MHSMVDRRRGRAGFLAYYPRPYLQSTGWQVGLRVISGVDPLPHPGPSEYRPPYGPPAPQGDVDSRGYHR